MPDKRMTLYINEKDREAIKKLFELLDKKGVDLRDDRGNPSVSAMFRFLRDSEIKRLSK